MRKDFVKTAAGAKLEQHSKATIINKFCLHFTSHILRNGQLVALRMV